MTVDETVALTMAMVEVKTNSTGQTWMAFCRQRSTSAVSDKISGARTSVDEPVRVPMISGRGLGHTGGTLDKLEAIPGYRTDLVAPAQTRSLMLAASSRVRRVSGASRPHPLRAEKRDRAVPSIPLITASILSKKLAEGIDELVLDVK